MCTRCRSDRLVPGAFAVPDRGRPDMVAHKKAAKRKKEEENKKRNIITNPLKLKQNEKKHCSR